LFPFVLPSIPCFFYYTSDAFFTPVTHFFFYTSDTFCSSFKAPELMSYGEDEAQAAFSSKLDVWALGITIWSMFELQFPFEEANPSVFWVANFYRSGKRLSFGTEWNLSLQTLVKKCWKDDPEARPSVSEIVKILKESQNCRTHTSSFDYDSSVECIQ
jgi:serine/threonine protein kinase